jgi:hypothetical protein
MASTVAPAKSMTPPPPRMARRMKPTAKATKIYSPTTTPPFHVLSLSSPSPP